MTDDEFRQWLGRDNERRCILVQMDYIAEGAGSPIEPETKTLYFSDQVFFDYVTHHVYVDVVNRAPRYSRQLSGERLGTYTSQIDSLELDNADGGLDFMLNLACDGSQIRFYYGSPDWPVEAAGSPDDMPHFMHIFSAIVAKVSAPTFDRISVALKDAGVLLNKSIGGTTTVGGSGPYAEKARPLNFGYIHNLEPLILERTPSFKYVHSDDADTEALEVRDRGVSIGFTDNADGTFSLTGGEPEGQVTCDVLAEPNGGGEVLVSDAFDYLVGERAGLTALSLYEGAGETFEEEDADDYKVGISIPEARNVIDVLDGLTESGNCFWGVKRTGEFFFGRLRPNDIDSLPGDEVTILEDDIVPKGAFRIENATPLYYKYQATMSRNQVQQTDLSDLLNQNEQAVHRRVGVPLTQPDESGGSYNERPERYHKTLAVSPWIDTLLSEEFSGTDVNSLAQWMITKRASELPWLQTATTQVGIDFYQTELGNKVRVMQPRFDEDEGALFQAIGVTLDLSAARTEFRLIRRNVIQAVPASWLRDDSVLDDSQPEYAKGSLTDAPDEDSVDLGPLPGGSVSRKWLWRAGSIRMSSEVATYDKITIEPASVELFACIDDIRFGISSSGGGVNTSLAGFTTAHSGISIIENFEGETGGDDNYFAAAPSFAGEGFTLAGPGGGNGPYIAGKNVLGSPSAFLAENDPGGLLTITFSPPVNCVGMLISAGTEVGNLTFRVYDGATLLNTFTYTSVPAATTFNAFYSYNR